MGRNLKMEENNAGLRSSTAECYGLNLEGLGTLRAGI